MTTAVGAEAVILVEGSSDRHALETLAPRLGRNLAAEGVHIVAMGGATNIGRYLRELAQRRVRLVGLCDVGEADYFRRGVQRAGLTSFPFHVCVRDLEDELIRALGVDRVQDVIDAEGELSSFRVLQKQPAQRARSTEQQLWRFLGSGSGRKSRYARLFVEALDPGAIPAPLLRVLEDVGPEAPGLSSGTS
jgi:hypothetical protein